MEDVVATECSEPFQSVSHACSTRFLLKSSTSDSIYS
jgi:hypothetical protein